MRSINFPNMFSATSTNIITENDAVQRNLQSLLLSEKGELFGDPFYGIRLKRYLFDQNNAVLKDIIIDEIYTQVAMFMPQLTIKRNDIKIEQTQGKLTAKIRATNNIDFQTDLYNIVLFQEEEE